MSSKEYSLLQKTYIQKSGLFLLPLTGLPKSKHFKYTNTYLSSSDLLSDAYPNGISIHDQILIITYNKSYKTKDEELYKKIESSGFKALSGEESLPTGWEKFETEILISNPNFLALHELEDEFVYTYNLSDWDSDWKCFLKGRYSLMSEKAKDKIIKFRWKSLHQTAQHQLYCFLYPNEEKCMQAFAEELEIPLEDLLQVKELCSKPDFKLETYKCLLKQKTHEAEG